MMPVWSENHTLRTTDAGLLFGMLISVMVLWAHIGFSVNTHFVLNTFEMCHLFILRCILKILNKQMDRSADEREAASCCEQQGRVINAVGLIS